MLSDEAISIYEIAYHLKIPVYKILDEMPYEELLGWYAYFDLRPIEWRDDDRSFKFLQTQGFKGKPWEVFPSLEKIYNQKIELEEDQLNIRSLKSSFFMQKILESQNGEKLNFEGTAD
jgi:hypothetical protein